MTLSASDLLGHESPEAQEPKPVLLEPGSATAQAIYRVFAGYQRTSVVVPGFPERVRVAAEIAAVVANRSVDRVRLLAEDSHERTILTDTVRHLVYQRDLLGNTEVCAPAERRKLTVSASMHSLLPTVHVVVDGRRPDDISMFLDRVMAPTRVVYVAARDWGWATPEFWDTKGEMASESGDIPLDIVLAGAPDDDWSLEQPCH